MAALNPEFKPKTKYPDLVPFNMGGIDKDANQYDTAAYARSDADFARRHAPILGAEKAFQGQVSKDWTGEHELMPQIQREFMKSGIAGALDSFGDAGPVLAADSAGEAKVAQNLGLDIMGFQDRNRANRMASLSAAEQIFPRRSFGIDGESAALLNMLNTQNTNNNNQAKYANDLQLEQYNYRVDAANHQAEAAQKNADAQAAAARRAAVWQAISAGAQQVYSGVTSGMCWVARAVFGGESPLWIAFRSWMLQSAPEEIRAHYARHGERIAQNVQQNPELREAFRLAMLRILAA